MISHPFSVKYNCLLGNTKFKKKVIVCNTAYHIAPITMSYHRAFRSNGGYAKNKKKTGKTETLWMV